MLAWNRANLSLHVLVERGSVLLQNKVVPKATPIP